MVTLQHRKLLEHKERAMYLLDTTRSDMVDTPISLSFSIFFMVLYSGVIAILKVELISLLYHEPSFARFDT